MPTLEEINTAAPDTPVFILHLYCRALLNKAALKACGYTRDTPNPPGGEIQRDKNGDPTGLLIARPNAMILYATLAKGPKLPPEYQYNSSRQFMRELNRLGVTSARVYVAGDNLWTWSPLYKITDNLDVENITAPSDQLFTSSNAGDGYNYPMLKSFSLGVSITL